MRASALLQSDEYLLRRSQSSNVMDHHGELVRRRREGPVQQEGEGEEGEGGAMLDRTGSYIDPAAALEIARFGLSKKETAALDQAIEDDRAQQADADKLKRAAEGGGTVGGGVGGRGTLGSVVNDEQDEEEEDEEDEDEDELGDSAGAICCGK